MIYFDISRSQRARHRSGLTRVSSRLLQAFGNAARPVAFFRPVKGTIGSAAAALGRDDWLLTAELFSEPECPGLWDFIRERRCRLAAIFHDAIPLKLPHITWPQSVARHPEYMKMLAGFDRVFAISEASRQDLLGFWRWQGVTPRATVETLALGADFAGGERVVPGRNGAASLLCIGILEPRKNQQFLLETCEALWRDGLAFDLHVVGRVNPHFGKPVVAQIKSLQKRRRGLHYHEAAGDEVVARLYREVRATVFPTIAEGCGLPLLESLWMGVPCVCSDLPVLRENADAGGCVTVAVDDAGAWQSALRRVLTDDAYRSKLESEANGRSLPTWADTAQSIRARLSS